MFLRTHRPEKSWISSSTTKKTRFLCIRNRKEVVLSEQVGGRIYFVNHVDTKMKIRPGKLHYYEDSDVLYYLISEGEEEKAIELSPGVTVELNKEKEIVGIEILDASKFMKTFVIENFQRKIASSKLSSDENIDQVFF